MKDSYLKKSSKEILSLEDFIMEMIEIRFENGDYPFINFSCRRNAQKLEAGSFTMVVSFTSDIGEFSFKKSFYVIITYNNKQDLYNITITSSVDEGFKILFTYTNDDIEKLKEFSKSYLSTIIDEAVTKVAYRYGRVNLSDGDNV